MKLGGRMGQRRTQYILKQITTKGRLQGLFLFLNNLNSFLKYSWTLKIRQIQGLIFMSVCSTDGHANPPLFAINFNANLRTENHSFTLTADTTL